MKELTIEEKAKAYDEALERAKEINNEQRAQPFNVMTRVFPELRESEDERIRKAIIEFFESEDDNTTYSLVPKKDILAWLEKQGESDETKAKMFLINKGYPIDANGIFPMYEEMYNIIREGFEKQGEQKSAWSEEDESRMGNLCHFLEEYGNQYYGHLTLQGTISWLKSLRPQSQWKPSEEMLEALYRVIPENVMEISEDEMLLDRLYQGLKYGRVLSKK